MLNLGGKTANIRKVFISLTCGKLSTGYLLTLWSNYDVHILESAALKGETQFGARNAGELHWMMHWH